MLSDRTDSNHDAVDKNSSLDDGVMTLALFKNFVLVKNHSLHLQAAAQGFNWQWLCFC